MITHHFSSIISADWLLIKRQSYLIFLSEIVYDTRNSVDVVVENDRSTWNRFQNEAVQSKAAGDWDKVKSTGVSSWSFL